MMRFLIVAAAATLVASAAMARPHYRAAPAGVYVPAPAPVYYPNWGSRFGGGFGGIPLGGGTATSPGGIP